MTGKIINQEKFEEYVTRVIKVFEGQDLTVNEVKIILRDAVDFVESQRVIDLNRMQYGS